MHNVYPQISSGGGSGIKGHSHEQVFEIIPLNHSLVPANLKYATPIARPSDRYDFFLHEWLTM
jgi:hypothetical protein